MTSDCKRNRLLCRIHTCQLLVCCNKNPKNKKPHANKLLRSFCLMRTKASLCLTKPLPLSVCLSCGIRKSSRRCVHRWQRCPKGICFPVVRLVWLFDTVFGFLTLFSAAPLLGANSHTQPTLDLSVTSDQAIIPGWLTTQWESVYE